MSILSKFLGRRFHAAIVDENEDTLAQAITEMKLQYKEDVDVEGFTNYRDLFLRLNVSKAKDYPFDVALIHEYQTNLLLSNILKRTDPNLKLVKYQDPKSINECLTITFS
jgi:uncharacterized protein (UPF0305 family)